MTITTEISKLQENLANAYSSIEEKGATLPTNQNFDNLATAIDSIPSGSSSKYNLTIDSFIGDTDINGVLKTPTMVNDISFTGVTDIANSGLRGRFNGSNLTSVSFPSLTTISGLLALSDAFRSCHQLTSVSFPLLANISGDNACSSAWNGCSNLTTIDFQSLTTILSDSAFYYAFQMCSKLTSMSFPSLTTISGNSAFYYAFQSCYDLTSVSFPSLTTISGNSALQFIFSSCSKLTSMSFPSLMDISLSTSTFTYAFAMCGNLTDVYFNALKTTSFGSNINQFNNMMGSNYGKTTICTLHFPSNLESTIQTLTGYPLFGGSNGKVVLAYDLPATS